MIIKEVGEIASGGAQREPRRRESPSRNRQQYRSAGYTWGRLAVPGLLRQHSKDSGCGDQRHLPVGVFFPLSLEHAGLFIWIVDQ
jgi:hypothetical protein